MFRVPNEIEDENRRILHENNYWNLNLAVGVTLSRVESVGDRDVDFVQLAWKLPVKLQDTRRFKGEFQCQI